MNHIEVMKQALEALEYHTEQTRPLFKTEHAIVALKEAIAEQQRDWSLLEATQDSLREHMVEIKRLKALLEQSAPVPLMDNQVLLAAHNEDPGDWNDLNFKKSWYDGFVVGFRAAEDDHGIKGEPK
jgi:hypothetical protein